MGPNPGKERWDSDKKMIQIRFKKGLIQVYIATCKNNSFSLMIFAYKIIIHLTEKCSSSVIFISTIYPLFLGPIFEGVNSDPILLYSDPYHIFLKPDPDPIFL